MWQPHLEVWGSISKTNDAGETLKCLEKALVVHSHVACIPWAFQVSWMSDPHYLSVLTLAINIECAFYRKPLPIKLPLAWGVIPIFPGPDNVASSWTFPGILLDLAILGSLSRAWLEGHRSARRQHQLQMVTWVMIGSKNGMIAMNRYFKFTMQSFWAG